MSATANALARPRSQGKTINEYEQEEQLCHTGSPMRITLPLSVRANERRARTRRGNSCGSIQA
ncbi:MAG: hypothetical protein IPI91_14540 [Flavobacteriales bacterium]|nr:hypothetical protein [Flavobacteriales bacterium]